MRHLVTTVLLAAFPIAAAAPVNPFGLVMGTPLSQLQTLPGFKKLSSGKYSYEITTPPTPNAQFESYLLLVTPKAGLCKVIGLGVTLRNDSYGDEVRSRFNTLNALLVGKYGKAETFDFLKSGSIWDERRDFAMGLNKKERYLSAFWTREKLSLPDDIESIGLDGRALNSSDTYLTLGYEFRNLDACQAEVKADNGDGL